ncbi:hypothetical protein [Streptomyces sp. NPDC048639]|uniref:hypothetical protein n=1 Tax=Streptomyces sp. NPDC048639 TaxID=3365581 RepID=UPI003711FD28
MSKADAPKALEEFTEGYNTAYRTSNPAALAKVETGPLQAMNQPGVKAQRKNRPAGYPDYPELELTDAKFTIPKQAGWPKFFLADADSNRDDNRWLLLFVRDGAKEPWKAAYLSILSPDEVPEFKTDEEGWARPVARGTAQGLAMAPGRLSTAYARYLKAGKGKKFAEGQATTGQIDTRDKLRRTARFWTEYIDQPAKPPQYAPVALRLADGGALAFFAAHHAEKRTMAEGFRVGQIDDGTASALMTGKPRKWVSLSRISESAVRIPPQGPVVFLNRLEGVTAAKGG